MSRTINHGEYGLWEYNDSNHCECSLCGHVVTDDEAYKLKECPDCGAFMKKQKYTFRDAETVPVVTEQAETEHNAVNPLHYKQGGIECKDCIKAALGEHYIGFLIGNVIKYTYRYQHKNGVEDLKKAAVYLDWAIKELSNDEE